MRYGYFLVVSMVVFSLYFTVFYLIHSDSFESIMGSVAINTLPVQKHLQHLAIRSCICRKKVTKKELKKEIEIERKRNRERERERKRERDRRRDRERKKEREGREHSILSS